MRNHYDKRMEPRITFLVQHPELWNEDHEKVVIAMKAALVVSRRTYWKDVKVQRLIQIAVRRHFGVPQKGGNMENAGFDVAEHRVKAIQDDQSCYEKAKARGQQTFTLVEQDRSSPKVIAYWILENIETAPPEKLIDAVKDAIAMRGYAYRKSAD